MRENIVVIAADRIIDGNGNFKETLEVQDRIKSLGLSLSELKIATLKMHWENKLPSGYIKNACSPLHAVLKAEQLFTTKKADVLILTGEDNCKSGYTKVEKDKFKQIYGKNETLIKGYSTLANQFIKYLGVTKDDFHNVAKHLFENYSRTFYAINPDSTRPAKKWFEFITEYFRGVDCANPSIDFSGSVILATKQVADRCEVPADKRIKIVGCEVKQVGIDGLDSIPDIARYDHLERAFYDVCKNTGVDFRTLFLERKALLETYTCFPVVPIAFLLRSGFVNEFHEIPTFLKDYEITITGGLNLARAAWNNSTLNSLIAMVENLRTNDSVKIGGIHANACLGYQQGFMILKTEV